MKTTLTVLVAFILSSLSLRAITLTINHDNPSVFDFTYQWADHEPSALSVSATSFGTLSVHYLTDTRITMILAALPAGVSIGDTPIISLGGPLGASSILHVVYSSPIIRPDHVWISDYTASSGHYSARFTLFNPVPDQGHTALMLAGAVAVVLWAKRRAWRTPVAH